MSSIFRAGDLVLFGEIVCLTDGTEEQMPERLAVIVEWVGPHYRAAIVERLGIDIDRVFIGELTVLAR